jgi:hypothetical protein
MTTPPNEQPDLSSYLRLIDDLIANRLGAPEFQKEYLSTLQSEQRIFGDQVFGVIQTLFEDADAYVQYPELRTEPEDLDDEQLRQCAIRARDQLRALGYA